jgi:DNA-binding GntR family transcriptional regulator
MRTTNSLPLPHAELSPQNSHQRAAPYIRRLILDGVLSPGVRVPQDEIASALGLSRNPIREALIALNAEGWITIEPNRGAFVNTFDKSTIADHFEICAFIHTLAMRHGLELSGDELVSKLDEILNSFTPKTDVTEAGRLTIEFHSRVISSARSSRIVAVHRANSTLVPGNFFEYVPNARGIEREGMLAIVKAAKKSDMEAVGEAYERLMRRLAKEVTQLFKNRGLFEHKGSNAA